VLQFNQPELYRLKFVFVNFAVFARCVDLRPCHHGWTLLVDKEMMAHVSCSTY
jgi:hypothetical protein